MKSEGKGGEMKRGRVRVEGKEEEIIDGEGEEGERGERVRDLSNLL